MIGNGQVIDIPPDYFVHPQTGCVLPVQGNVAYDPVTSRLVVTVDSTFGRWKLFTRNKRFNVVKNLYFSCYKEYLIIDLTITRRILFGLPENMDLQ